MDYWAIIFAIIIGLLVIYYFFIWDNYFAKNGIPHHKPLPILGDMAGVLLGRRTFFDQVMNISNVNKDAKYCGLHDFTYPVILIRDLNIIKNIAIKYFDHFTDRRGFTDPDLEPLHVNNLISLRGDTWRGARNLLTPAFTTGKIKAMLKSISQCAETFSNSLNEKCDGKTVEFNSKDIFTRFTNDTIVTCAFGIAVDSMKNPNNEFYVAGKKATDFRGINGLKYLFARSFPRLATIARVKLMDRKVEDFFFKMVRETIATRDAQEIYRPDMIQLMMETRGNKSDSKKSELSIENMTSLAFGFFFGGFDSSSTIICFMAHELSVNPECQKKLQDEIDQVMKEHNGEPTYEAVNNMEYLDAVINETMRLYSPNPFMDRVCTKSFELPPPLPGGKPVMLKPGDIVWLGIWGIHRDPKYFPDPESFNPERFLGENKANFNFNAFMPFGIGPRICIGNRFALLKLKILFLYLMSKFDITPGEKMILPMRFSKSSIFLTPEGGFWLDLKPRKLSN